MSKTMTLQTPRTRSLIRQAIMALTLVVWLTPSIGSTQNECAPPMRCMERSEVKALVAAQCLAHKKRAERLDAVTSDLEAATNQTQFCRGELKSAQDANDILTAQARNQRKQSPLWLRLALDASIVAIPSAAVGLALMDASESLVVGFSVAGLGAIVWRVVLELLD